MIDVTPTASVHVGAAVPLAALGRETFEPGTGMESASPGPSLALDLGVLLAHHVLPYVAFERAWLSCVRPGECGAQTSDAVSLAVRVTSSGRLRVFGEFGVGFRRLTQEPNPWQSTRLSYLALSSITENRAPAPDAPEGIRWTGFDRARFAVGSAYELRRGVLLEAKVTAAIGSFDHVRAGGFVSYEWIRGFEADLARDERTSYVLLGCSLGLRFEL